MELNTRPIITTMMAVELKSVLMAVTLGLVCPLHLERCTEVISTTTHTMVTHCPESLKPLLCRLPVGLTSWNHNPDWIPMLDLVLTICDSGSTLVAVSLSGKVTGKLTT